MMLLHLQYAKRHASTLSSFLLENSSYFGVDEIVSFYKLVGDLDKITDAKLGKQCSPRIFGLLFQELLRKFVFV